MEVLRTMFEVDKLLVTNAVNRFTENTPLHLATEGGHLEAVKLMLLNGVAPNDENKFGLTPVHLGELLLHICTCAIQTTSPFQPPSVGTPTCLMCSPRRGSACASPAPRSA